MISLEIINVSTAMLQVRICLIFNNLYGWFCPQKTRNLFSTFLLLNLDPDWASINLGVLICIECSGVHRNLGSHISRVRSLDLDEWPPGHLAVMTALGNRTANSLWEGRLPHPGIKPSPTSSQEEKERFIIAKYSRREFLIPVLNQPGNMNNAANLVDAICR